MGAIHGADPGGEAPGFEKMPGFPGNGFSLADKPRDHSGDGPFVGSGRRYGVQANAATQVEYPFDGGVDECCQVDFRHFVV